MPKKPIGRPTRYSEEEAQRVCEAVARHGSPERAYEADNTLPGPRTVYAWRWKHPEFQQSLTHAREAGTHATVGRMSEQAEQLVRDTEAGEVSRSRVRALQHLASVQQFTVERMNRKEWGPTPAISIGDVQVLTAFSDMRAIEAHATATKPRHALPIVTVPDGASASPTDE